MNFTGFVVASALQTIGRRWMESYCLMDTEFPFGIMKKLENSCDGFTELWML